MSIKRNITLSYAIQIINTGLTFAASVFITRILGTEGRGEFAVYSNALVIASIWLGFSLPSSIVYFVSSKKLNPGKMLTTMLWFCLTTTILVTLTIMLLIHEKKTWLIFPENYKNYFWIGLFIVQFFLAQVNSVLNAFLNARKVFIPQAVFGSIVTAISVIVWLLLYFKIIHVPYTGFAIVVLITFLFSLPPILWNLFLLNTVSKIDFTFKIIDFKSFMVILKFALIAYACNAIQILSYRMDLWFVDYYHGKSETGIYSLAVSLAQLIWILPNTMSGVLLTYLSGSTRDEAIAVTLKYARLAIYSSLLFAVFCSIVFYFAIPLVFGSEFEFTRILIILLFTGIVPFSITTILATFNASINKPVYNLWTTLWGFVFALVFYVLLIPRIGSMGAAIASSISYNACNVYIFYKFYKTTQQKIWLLLPLKADYINFKFQVSNYFAKKQ
ncbi:MAG: polysaccharide biosynthesis C-terminal domain-containing protein [Bacteroidota bacterium]|nr:polysaccharide biosynthesis C-terminal domain-containing protein [Bacteroidota bacterium]